MHVSEPCVVPIIILEHPRFVRSVDASEAGGWALSVHTSSFLAGSSVEKVIVELLRASSAAGPSRASKITV